jgi:hypothetical protein
MPAADPSMTSFAIGSRVRPLNQGEDTRGIIDWTLLRGVVIDTWIDCGQERVQVRWDRRAPFPTVLPATWLEQITDSAAVTADSVAAWSLEVSADHVRMIPAMPNAERQAWIDLNHLSATRKLTKDERRLLAALDRKVKYRARFEKI